ncbi:MAG TPA: EamA family transporter [Pirellulaceae bacterium]|nr:EamA family transporter [Pirellulaceae bacterium]HMO93485.1 EamA family transporter [Pirellulaceae bacterium]HMP69200.1 EamA family transporter [Pirellulaceae bacterium]
MSEQLRNRAWLIKVVLAFAAVYLIWGSTYLAIQIAIKTLPIFFMAGLRFLIAGGLLYVFASRSAPKPTANEWRLAALVGGLLLLGGNGLVCFGQQYVPSGLAALLVSSLPLWMAIINWLFFTGRKPMLRTIISILIGLIGVVMLLGGSPLYDDSGKYLYALAVLLAPVSWAFGSLRSRQGGLPKSPWLSTAMQMICGGIMLLVAGLVHGEVDDMNLSMFSVESVLALLYLIVFGSLIAFTAFVWLLQNVDPERVATYAFVNPVVAVLLGWMIAGEQIKGWQIPGMVLVVGAVAMTVLYPKEALPNSAAKTLD